MKTSITFILVALSLFLDAQAIHKDYFWRGEADF